MYVLFRRLEHKESRYFFLLDLPKKVSKCLHIDRINIQLKPICTTIGRRRSRGAISHPYIAKLDTINGLDNMFKFAPGLLADFLLALVQRMETMMVLNIFPAY